MSLIKVSRRILFVCFLMAAALSVLQLLRKARNSLRSVIRRTMKSISIRSSTC